MKKKIYILIGIFLSFTLLLFLWWNQAVKPVAEGNTSIVLFSVAKGENVRGIAERLQKQNFIRSAVAFFLLTRFGGIADRIQAGEFRLTPSMDMRTIATTLTHGSMDVQITIPEGWRNAEIALKLAKELGIPETDFLKSAKEGYMFPDTYRIPKDVTTEDLVKIFLANFNQKVTPKDIEKASGKNLSLDNLITIASLVEREGKHDTDRPLIASVILNRLKLGMKLDIDATVQYALGYQPKEKSWWKKELAEEDIAIDSPYNTYKNAGLPPTSIANPGLAAIRAVIDAPETNYLYYISDLTGTIHPAQTIEEHNKNISKYLKVD